jgi:hypothetical protein
VGAAPGVIAVAGGSALIAKGGTVGLYTAAQIIGSVNRVHFAKHKDADKSGGFPKGFKETKDFGYQHGQKVYEYRGKYYSRDVDAHNGGIWKVFESIGGKLKRIGTADKDLNIFKN